jgi:hypothetical protein
LLLKEFLLENQLMTVEQASARPKKDLAAMNPENSDYSEANTQVRKPKRPASKDEALEPVAPWIWIMSGAIAVKGAGFWAFVRRSASSA